MPGAAAFHHQRRTTMENGLAYECTSSYMRGDRVRLDVCFQKSGTHESGGLRSEKKDSLYKLMVARQIACPNYHDIFRKELSV